MTHDTNLNNILLPSFLFPFWTMILSWCWRMFLFPNLLNYFFSSFLEGGEKWINEFDFL